jgi:hypothetical protein
MDPLSRAIHSQSSKPKHYIKSNLLLSSELQTLNFRDRESDNEDVLENVDSAIHPSYRIKVDALAAMYVLIPDV